MPTDNSLPKFIQELETIGAHVDTAELFAPWLSKEAMRRLPEDTGVTIRFDEIFDENDVRRGWRVVIHQPPRQKLKVIEQFRKKHSATLMSFAVAYDFARSPELLDWFKNQIVLKGMPRGWAVDIGDTTYSVDFEGGRRSNRAATIYPRFSKIDGQECVRLELKFQRTSATRREGYETVMELAQLNPHDLFAKHFRIVEQFDPEPYIAAEIKREVRAQNEREKTGNRKYRPFTDKYLARLPKRIRNYHERVETHRAQNFKVCFPRQYAKLATISAKVLKLPSELLWTR